MFQSYNYLLHVSYIFFQDSVYATYIIIELTDGIKILFFFFKTNKIKFCVIYTKPFHFVSYI